MNGNWKMSLAIFASVVGASVSIVVLITYMVPFARSDSPPLAGIDRVAALAKTVENSLLVQQQTTEALNRLSNRMDQQELDHWNSQIAVAELRLKIMPNDDLAKTMLTIARGEMAIIQKRIITGSK